MSLGRKLLWNVYVGAIGAATALAVNKALRGAWTAATGEEPPTLHDPRTPVRDAVVWTAASATAMAVTTVLVNRVAARVWERVVGEPAPGRRD